MNITKQQLQDMLDETIEELQKPNAAMQFQRFRQLIFHRANLEMKLRDLEKPKPEPEKTVPLEDTDEGPYYGFYTTRHPQPESYYGYESREEELFS